MQHSSTDLNNLNITEYSHSKNDVEEPIIFRNAGPDESFVLPSTRGHNFQDEADASKMTNFN